MDGKHFPMRWKRHIRVNRDGVAIVADVNLVADVNYQGTKAEQAKGAKMPDEVNFKALSREELNELAGEELPERAAMSLLNANVAIPINAAVAANVLSDNATAVAQAAQSGAINQHN
jgi:hypothetical protein